MNLADREGTLPTLPTIRPADIVSTRTILSVLVHSTCDVNITVPTDNEAQYTYVE